MIMIMMMLMMSRTMMMVTMMTMMVMMMMMMQGVRRAWQAIVCGRPHCVLGKGAYCIRFVCSIIISLIQLNMQICLCKISFSYFWFHPVRQSNANLSQWQNVEITHARLGGAFCGLFRIIVLGWQLVNSTYWKLVLLKYCPFGSSANLFSWEACLPIKPSCQKSHSGETCWDGYEGGGGYRNTG